MSHPFEPPNQAALPAFPRKFRKYLLALVFTFLALTVGIPWLASFATDWLWFGEVGFRSVFVTSLVWRLLLFFGAGLIAFAFLYANLRAARGGHAPMPVLFISRRSGTPVDLYSLFTRMFLPIAIVISLVIAISAATLWLDVLKAVHGVPVGVTDPLFGRDLGFYLFKLPIISALLDMASVLTLFALVGGTILHWVRERVAYRFNRLAVSPDAASHLGKLLILLFVLRAVRIWLVDSAGLLQSTTGPLVGASYTDVHVALPGLYISAIAALAAAALVLYGMLRGKLGHYAVGAVVMYVVVGILAAGAAPALYQKLVVVPNELDRERPYLQRHIDATRRAWGLAGVDSRELNGEVQLSMSDIRANAATVDNVRLWERDLLMQTFSQLQEIRTYYDFVSSDDDRYVIDGKYRQVHIAARELNPASLPTRTFINERLTFTHGMGVTMAPVNQVTSEGLPVLFIRDLPPVSDVSVKLTRPQIYYGELTNEYVFVGTQQKEFDFPSGEKNIYTYYEGKGGVPVGSFARKLLYAFELGSLKILLSDDIKGGARILYRRNVLDRASTALPFLTFDADPYVVIDDAGQLKWILDAYTTSDRYPYSQRLQDGTSYMRNSVKVVIDAYDGTIDAYIADPRDPVIETYSRIFGKIFKPLSAMPTDLQRHLRYPGDLFKIQATLHATYHMLEPDAFYHQEDQWQIPAGQSKEEAQNPFMRHMIMRLPGEKNPEFIYMMPFTPKGKDNLSAWMVARMDGANYGKLVVYRFPKQSLVYGPKQIVNRINQDTEISRQLTLWDQRGSEVIRGELLVIPIEESLIYVQPIYLRAEGGSIPELKRVVVAHENRVVMAETLEQGLDALFGAGATTGTAAAPSSAAISVDSAEAVGGSVNGVVGGGVTPSPTPAPAGPISPRNAALAKEAQQHYDRAMSAQKAGDWATYGREINLLGAAIRAMGGGR